MSRKKIALALGIVVVVGVGSFYVGMKYAGNSRFAACVGGRQFSRAMGNITGQRGGRTSGGAGAGFVSGKVISKDKKTITVEVAGGGSKIVFISESIPVMKSTSGSLSDVVVVEQVMINGTSNQDGSLNAQSVQIKSEISNTQAGN